MQKSSDLPINLPESDYFRYETVEQGIEKYIINLAALYPNSTQRELFETRWEHFYLSDPTNPFVFFKEGDNLTYFSESIIPITKDARPRLLLVFGNPAPHSIKEKTFFSYEGPGREHRVWKIFRNVGLVKFTENNALTNSDKNFFRKQQLWNTDYDSPFILGFVPYFSMPSTPSTEPWTGVSGIRRLFGTQVLRQIESAEKERMKYIISNFMPNEGTIIAFQKDAYNGLRHETAEVYKRSQASEIKLLSLAQNNENIKIYSSVPTRSIHSMKSREFLKSIISSVES